MLSSEIAWNTAEFEAHNLMDVLRFIVQKAKQLVVEAPREVQSCGLSGLRNFARRPEKMPDGSTRMYMGMYVKWKAIDAEPERFDCSIPILLVPLPERLGGSVWPIDGWHRIAKTLDAGGDELPAVLLTEAEAVEICPQLAEFQGKKKKAAKRRGERNQA